MIAILTNYFAITQENVIAHSISKALIVEFGEYMVALVMSL